MTNQKSPLEIVLDKHLRDMKEAHNSNADCLQGLIAQRASLDTDIEERREAVARYTRDIEQTAKMLEELRRPRGVVATDENYGRLARSVHAIEVLDGKIEDKIVCRSDKNDR
jgi:hypothetical protein